MSSTQMLEEAIFMRKIRCSASLDDSEQASGASYEKGEWE